MKSTSGTVIRTGTFIAFSSARWRRFTRISRLWILSTLPTGTPSWSAWTMARQKERRSASVVRSAIARIASVRPTPSCISWISRCSSCDSGPVVCWATRCTAASKPRPASTEMVSRSIESGSSRCISDSRFCPALWRRMLGST